MKKGTRNIFIGLLLIAGGLFGMTLKVNNTGHYFGTGTIFGIGLCIIGCAIFKRK